MYSFLICVIFLIVGYFLYGKWVASVYLKQHGRNIWITVIPAVFMSAVSLTYFFASPECMGLLWNLWNIPMEIYYPIAVAAGILFAACFLIVFLKKMVWRVSRMP